MPINARRRRRARPHTRRVRTYSSRRRIGSRRRYYRRRGSRFPRYVGFPSTQRVKLAYGDVWPLDTGVTAVTYNKFRLNSIYDPDETGAGGTPTGASIYTAQFKRYLVTGAKITLRCINTCAKPIFVVAAHGGPDAILPGVSGTDVQQWALEMPRCHKLALNAAANERSTGVMSWYVSMRRVMPGATWNDYDFSAQTGANPSKIVYMQIALANQDGTATANTCNVIVRIVYYVRFYEAQTNETD